MFGKKKEIPIYLFTGFLESGKTQFIAETLKDGQFKDGNKTLYIICEEGVEEIPQRVLDDNMFVPCTIESEEDVSFDTFMKLDLDYDPDRVMIEYNGTWDPDKVIEAFPENWLLAEGICTIDATTYQDYLANMKQMMTRQFTYADLVIFNRCDYSQDLPMFKRTVRALNRRSQVVFEMKDGTINNNVKEELPYDINSDVIEVEDDDYGIWYIDVFDNLDTYKGKTVRFKGVVYKPKRSKEDIFVPGRFAMTCCAADIQFVGFPCKWKDAKVLKEKTPVYVTAKIGSTETNEGSAPVLYADAVEITDPPEEEVVYFQ
ncbi:MAG: TIGR03943 family protein [Lachnospiraceae bacterium]|nr:TIGR03943 family protein [Lachnospiraceae bacterium]MBQ9606094.1 TIGR03943 family protein [Lachnospiraceae bacterium]